MLACPFSGCLYERTISIKQTYIFIHGECLFLTRVPLPHADSKLWFSHRVEMRQLFVCVWKVEGKEAFSWSESTVNRALHPAQLFCKWIRFSGIILWIPLGQTDTDNCIFYFPCFASAFAYVLGFVICVDHLNLFCPIFFKLIKFLINLVSPFSQYSKSRSCWVSFHRQMKYCQTSSGENVNSSLAKI